MVRGRERVVLLRREDNEDGDMHVVERLPFDGCVVQPEPGTETYDRGQSVRQRFRVHGPAGLAAARAIDALEVAGWHVAAAAPVAMPLYGGPASWPDRRTGGVHHVELVVEYSAG